MYYTKYRPQVFSEISRPNETAEALATQIKTGRSVHAYLFIGPRGTGKTTTARIMAKALNCADLKENGDPCAECDSCEAIKNGSFLDLIEIDAASNRGIDDIRDLKEKIRLAPSFGKRKIYIIDEVHMLTQEAFNALLKTLEEPPPRVTFILCTTEAHKVPETIKSRCQVFKFKRASVAQITKKLESISDKENISISKQDLRQIATIAHGGFRDAETLLQQVAEGEINVQSLTSMGEKENYADFLDYIISREIGELFRMINLLDNNGIDLYVWTGEWLKYLREVLLVSSEAHEELVDVSDEILERIEKQTKIMKPSEIVRIIESFIKAQNEIKGSSIPQLPLELAVVSLLGDELNDFEDRVARGISPELNSIKNETIEEKYKADGGKKDGVIQTNTINVETVEVTDENKLSVDIDVVKNNWKAVLRDVSGINSGVSALLKTARLSSTEGKKIILEVPFDFHKERLESTRNRKIIEDVISSILEMDIRIKCYVKKQERKTSKPGESGTLTDYNVMISTSVSSAEGLKNTLDVFDGALPIPC